MPATLIGCAGWQLPKSIQAEFPGPGTHLARYARRLPAVEVNVSFYRDVRSQLYRKWAGEAGPQHRFCVKLPRSLTHHQRLRGTDGLDAFLEQVAGLGSSLGALLVQLPPSLRLEPERADAFFAALRDRVTVPVLCEPRHESWLEENGEALLRRHRIGRVAADPPVTDGADEPGGDRRVVYYRLHGRPRRFYSDYETTFLDELALRLRKSGADRVWCIFNNTATDAGLRNALALRERLQG